MDERGISNIEQGISNIEQGISNIEQGISNIEQLQSIAHVENPTLNKGIK
jgi:uncharacterized phage infection (PIP) family protein YhgE